MKQIYLRQSSISTSSVRQSYLTSDEKQEYLLAHNELELLPEFKNINKELVIELPNEFLNEFYNVENEAGDLLDLYISKFKELTNYENVSGAIHLNSNQTNLHMHLSYVDRKFEEIENIYKKDRYIYTSGKPLKMKDYDENNPQHIKVKSGEAKLNFDLIDASKLEEYLKKLKDNTVSNSEKFNLRREIIKETSQPTIKKWTSCLESNKDILSVKDTSNTYKKHFRELNNSVLKQYGYDEKYISKEKYDSLGLLSTKKVGKLVDDKPNKIQKNILKYNEYVEEYNNQVLDLYNNKNIPNTLVTELGLNIKNQSSNFNRTLGNDFQKTIELLKQLVAQTKEFIKKGLEKYGEIEHGNSKERKKSIRNRASRDEEMER